MPLVTKTELLEIVPELRAMAATAKTPTVRATLILLADRYAAMAAVGRGTTSDTGSRGKSSAVHSRDALTSGPRAGSARAATQSGGPGRKIVNQGRPQYLG